MLRHHNVARHHESVSHAQSIERTLEDMVCRWGAQQRLPVIATEGYEVKTSALLVTNELCHDARILYLIRRPKCVRAHPSAKSRGRMGHPQLWDGQGFKSLGCATRRLAAHHLPT